MTTIFLVLLFMLAMYLVPGIVATARQAKYQTAVWAINVFLGWTIIGWMAALALAFISEGRGESGANVLSVNGASRTAGTSARHACLLCHAIVPRNAMFCPTCGALQAQAQPQLQAAPTSHPCPKCGGNMGSGPYCVSCGAARRPLELTV